MPPKLSETWKEEVANTNTEAVLKTCEFNSKLLVFLKFILAVYNVWNNAWKTNIITHEAEILSCTKLKNSGLVATLVTGFLYDLDLN